MVYLNENNLNEIGKSPTMHLGVKDQWGKPKKADKNSLQSYNYYNQYIQTH